MCVCVCVCVFDNSALGPTDGAENREFGNVLSLKPGAGQNTALHASCASRNDKVLISTFSVN